MADAANASNGAIQTAINNTADGGTVNVPAGTATWTGSVTIPNTKGISLIGAGIGNTVCTLGSNQISMQTALGRSRSRVSGFTLIGGNGGTTTGAVHVGSQVVGATDWRVDHIRIVDVGHANPYNAIAVEGWTFGVIDHCAFENTGRGVFIQCGLNTSADPIMWGDYSWTQDIDIGSAVAGAYPRAVYCEDNTYTNNWDRTAQAFEGRWATRYVCRYNTVTGGEIDTHSGCTNTGRNCRWIEVYNNTNYEHQTKIDGPGAGSRAMHIRACNGVVFNNTLRGYLAGIHFDYEMSCISCGGGWESARRTYPAQDQIGAGKDTGWKTAQAMNLGLWAWNNTDNGSPTTLEEVTCSGLLVQDRDYFNSAKSGYTPYTYPHPLVGGSSPPVGTPVLSVR